MHRQIDGHTTRLSQLQIARANNQNSQQALSREPPVRKRRNNHAHEDHDMATENNWSERAELCLAFEGIPPSVTVTDIRQQLKKYGSLCQIIVYEDADGKSKGKGFLRFNPPPSEKFWVKPVEISHKRQLYHMKLWVKPTESRLLPGLVNTEHEYPAVVQTEASHIGIGTLLSPEKMLNCFSSSPSAAWNNADRSLYRTCPITVALNLEYRELHLTFPLHFSDGTKSKNGVNRTDLYRFAIPLQQRVQVFRTRSLWDSNGEALVFNIETPPTCYRTGDEAQALKRNNHRWSVNESLYRQVDVVVDPRDPSYKKKPTALRQDHSVLSIGQWTCYVLDISHVSSSAGFAQFCNCLRDHNIEIRECKSFGFTNQKPSRVWNIIDLPGLYDVDEPPSFDLGLLSRTVSLDFAVRYQLEVCISGGWFNEFQLDREFIERLGSTPPMRACALLEDVSSDQKEYIDRRIYDPMSIFRRVSVGSSTLAKKRPDWCAMIRSAIVTPTTIIVNTPACEISNRVIRYFSEHSDRFLRVRFLDERNRGRVYASVGRDTMNEVFTRVFKTMTNGIVVAGRRYEFLAFGNSQFRENGAYFFASTPTLTAERIRSWMGDFSHIRITAKYAARLGQCFSTTRAMKSVRPRIREIPDLERNGFMFTDGVGKISPSLASIASQDFKIPNVGNNPPSVFQFRLGGSKGILTVWPDVKGLELCIRPSQNKFKATKDDLEIIKWSQASEFSLNRQIIIVLSALGVSDNVFMGKMKTQLYRLNKAMEDEDMAEEVLRSSVDINGTTLTLAQMVTNGFHASKEPFVTTLIQLWRAWSIKFLKEKAKIHIPKGAVLLGCSDETGTLRGHFDSEQYRLRSASRSERLKAVPEVFVQLSNYEGTGHSKVIEGLMIIARNPSLHPGDIRVVKGVSVPALSHLKDCLVLPQTGDRDLSSMCSGGDLDGDDYVVCWDSDLIPAEWNHNAMDFTPPKPLEKNCDVTIKDIVEFFVQYMKNADLGNIAYSHLATADSEERGVKSDKCLQLAHIHSNAVDYPKSGLPANIPDYLRPKIYPHFMERRKGVYKSKKILGQLYDSVTLVDFNPAYDNPFDQRIIDAYDGNKDVLRAASGIKVEYDTAIRRIMAQHAIKSEFEVWSAFVLEKNRNYGDFKFSEILGDSVTALKDQFREICVEKAGSRDMNDLGPFVAAMYTVTKDEVEMALEECETSTWDEGGLLRAPRPKDPQHMPLMSFPWLFPTVLGRIAAGHGNRRSSFHGNSSQDKSEIEAVAQTSPSRPVDWRTSLRKSEAREEPDSQVDENETNTQTGDPTPLAAKPQMMHKLTKEQQGSTSGSASQSISRASTPITAGSDSPSVHLGEAVEKQPSPTDRVVDAEERQDVPKGSSAFSKLLDLIDDD